MWSDKLRLVFTTELSLIDQVKCLQYYFWSCAMDKAEGYTVQMQVPRTVAIKRSLRICLSPMHAQDIRPDIQ